MGLHARKYSSPRKPMRRPALREGEARAPRGFKSAVVGIFEITLDGRLLDANPTWLRLFGFPSLETAQQIPSGVWRLYAAPDQHQRIVEQTLQSATGHVEEVVFQDVNGNRFDAMMHIWAVRDNEQEETYLAGFIEDKTGRKAVEKALRDSEKKLQEVIKQSLEGIALANEDGRYIEWNRSMEMITGLPREYILGRELWEVQYLLNGAKASEEEQRILKQAVQSALESGEGSRFFQSYTIEYTHPNGSLRYLDGITYPIKTDRGFMMGVVLRDETGRWLAERAERAQRILADALRSTAEALASSISLDQVLDCILENLERVIPHDAANIMLVENDMVRLVRWNKYERHSRYFESIFEQRFALSDFPTFRHAAEQHAPLLTADTHQSAEWTDLPSSRWIRSSITAPIEKEGRLLGFINLDSATPNFFTLAHLNSIQAFSYQAAIALHNAQLYSELSQGYEATIEGWAIALSLRDHETQEHTLRVTDITMRIARHLGLSEEEMIHIRRGALLHDIGKIGIPDAILNKPGPLTEKEWEIMRHHPDYSREMISRIPYLKKSLDIPFSHHEHWDGSGYPLGLRGQAIPLVARIFAVVDVWDALTSDRVYRRAWSKEQTLEYIFAQAGHLFDPEVVAVFLELNEQGLLESPDGNDGAVSG